MMKPFKDSSSPSGSLVTMTETDRYHSTGIAPIKAEYRIAGLGRPDRRDDDAAEASTNPASGRSDESTGAAEGEPATKRIKLDNGSRGDVKDGQRARKKGGGQNKGRTFNRIQDPAAICFAFASDQSCRLGDSCKFSHDIRAYLAVKPKDIWTVPFPEARLSDLEGKAYDGSQLEPPIQIGSLWHLSEAVRMRFLDSAYLTEAPFVVNPDAVSEDATPPTAALSTLDPRTFCADFASRGSCTSSYKCRFLGAHAQAGGSDHHGGVSLQQASKQKRKQVEPSAKIGPRGFAAVVADDSDMPAEESNAVTSAHLKLIRKKKYPLPATREVLAVLDREEKRQADDVAAQKWGPIYVDREALDKEAATELEKALEASILAQKPLPKQKKSKAAAASGEMDLDDLENAAANEKAPAGAVPQIFAYSRGEIDASPEGSIDLARFRPSEKRRLDWAGKLYLAPLTTTGNLPFRRLCSTFGSDIHCGEMGLAESYLDGGSKEWNLVKRWEGERIFGTQVCGSKPELLIPTAEALMREVGSGLDFVDVNCGCPIDLVFKRGAGSALLDHATKLGKILRGMGAVLGDIPLTIKLRTGTSATKNTSHKLFPRLQGEFGVSAVTMHGRSRKQRYRKLADWDYIRTCAEALRAEVRAHNEEASHADEPEMVPIPIFGNGDVYGPTLYYDNLERTGVDGEMIARGALIKPWIFTEIKERRDWDISSRERLDMIRQFASYGLSHWGSDTQGVNTTRRFLCEALSFQYRYVPIGLLERLPAQMNDRPPAFRGRDDLETLLASGDSRDWVKLSEMFLGPAPDEWNFLPKHKSNSYGTEEGQEDQG